MCYKEISYRPKEVEGGRFDDDTHTNTCLLVPGFWVIKTHAYEYNTSGLSNSLGSLKLQIVDTVTVETTGKDEGVTEEQHMCFGLGG